MNIGRTVREERAGVEEYSIQWRLGEVDLRIDTAPLHTELSTFPNYLHGPNGSVSEDMPTRPGRAISGRAGAWYSMQSLRSPCHKSKF